MPIHISYYSAPCGKLILGSFEDKLCLCDWTNSSLRQRNDLRLCGFLAKTLSQNLGSQAVAAQGNIVFEESVTPILEKAIVELDEYFATKRESFDIPLFLAGTPFQKTVWNALFTIPYGETVSYAELACRIGTPRSVRAVAGAIGSNALSIFIPCHRVIASNATLAGYAGGLEAKRFLLDLENRLSINENRD